MPRWVTEDGCLDGKLINKNTIMSRSKFKVNAKIMNSGFFITCSVLKKKHSSWSHIHQKLLLKEHFCQTSHVWYVMIPTKQMISQLETFYFM